MRSRDPSEFSVTGPFTAARVLAAVMDHPTLAVAAVGHGRIKRFNASWSGLFGLAPDAPLGASMSMFFSGAKSAERFERVVADAFDRGVAQVEHLLTRSDGSTFMAEVVVHLLSVDNALEADAIWQVRDISAERELRRELHETEEYFRALSTYQWDLTLVLDREFYISYASPSVHTVLGYRASELIDERLENYMHPDEVEKGRRVFEDVLTGVNERLDRSFRVRMRHRNGDFRVLSCRQRNCLAVTRISGIVVNARDITNEVQLEDRREARVHRASRLRDALFDLSTAPWEDIAQRMDSIVRAAGEFLNIQSASFWRYDPEHGEFRCEVSYLKPGDLTVSDPMREIISESRYPQYVAAIHTHRPIVVNDVLEHPAVSLTHLERLQLANVGAMLDFPVSRSGATLGVLSIEFAGGPREWDSDEINFGTGLSLLMALALESADRAAAARRTEYMALHDSLTGLANRNRAEAELRAAIADAIARERRVGLLLIDIDEFKEINDTFGHGKGDRLLASVARVLIECTGSAGLVARMGGDEFLVVLPAMEQGGAELLAQSIINRLGADSLLEGIEQLGASIGIANFPEHGIDPESLLSNADIAMYQAKARGKGQFFAFNAKLAQRLQLQRDLDHEIRDALKRTQFMLFYQPQIDLTSGEVIGLEALLRWQHPRRGLLLPSTFMAAAEHNGLIDTITKWAITEVCEQNVKWQRAGLAALPISVNVTGRQFHDRHLPAIIAQALLRTSLPAHDLILEVTEESLIENGKTTERVLSELRRMGVRIAIDDFGVGYSSLNYLRRLVVSQIKLDKAFIQDLPVDAESSAIVAAVISIARQLKYQVIAEGVETKAQVDHLRALGCEAGQGFHFGAPLSVDEIEDFLREQTLQRTGTL